MTNDATAATTEMGRRFMSANVGAHEPSVAHAEPNQLVMNAGEQLIEKGPAQGAAGLRAIEVALSTRSIAVSEPGGRAPSSVHGHPNPDRWLTRALTSSSEVEVFADDVE